MRVALQGNLDSSTLAAHVRRFISDAGGTLPADVQIDFTQLTFIRPAGVTFLSNFTRWLSAKNVNVQFEGVSLTRAPVQYLDDSGFFLQHSGAKVNANAFTRSTTLPLCGIESDAAHQWVRDNMTPWMSRTLQLNQESVYPVTACLSEIFNNIVDHSNEKIGSIFAQHFPNMKELSICVADFGRGIPASVRTKHDEQNDSQCIIKAVARGFTTGGKNNAGEGLDYLLSTIVSTNTGRIQIQSLYGHVLFYNVKGAVTSHVLTNSGFCPGTTIDITLRTDRILKQESDSEDLQW